MNLDDTHVRRESRNSLVNDELGRIVLISQFFFLVGRSQPRQIRPTYLCER